MAPHNIIDFVIDSGEHAPVAVNYSIYKEVENARKEEQHNVYSKRKRADCFRERLFALVLANAH